MKCWNSAFNAQGSRVIIVVVHAGAVNIYVRVVEALRKKERGDKTQFPTKMGVKKLVWVPIIQFCNISFPVTYLMLYYAKTRHSHSLITWVYK
jgi:NADH:ubiquinone oxidoreductase subunit 6 (subunit J)